VNLASGVPANERSGREAKNKIISWPGVIPIGIVFIFLAWLSWRKWPDVLVDFGQQLYVPWKLSQGSVLYRDIMYVPGCLSVCYHALLFRIFGVSLNVLLVSNFLFLLVLLTVVCRCFLECSDRLTATIIGLATVVFAFAQFLDVGNYNYICPYSHEAFHGIVLSVVMIASLSRWLMTGRKLLLAVAGCCLGLTLLTKPEIFSGAMAPAAMALAIHWKQKPSIGFQKSLLLLAGSFFIPLIGFFFCFRLSGNLPDGLSALLWAWRPLFNSSVAQNPFFRSGMGLDVPWFHLRQMIVESGALGLMLVICAWRLGRPTLSSTERILIFSGVGGISIYFNWTHCGPALPLLVLCAAGLIYSEYRSAAIEQRSRLVFPALWVVYSLFLMAKMGLNARITHYGIFLAMPAFLSSIYLLIFLLPRFVQSLNLPPQHFRAAILVLLIAGFARLTIHSGLFYRDKDFPVGPASDRIITYKPAVDPTGADMAAAVDWIETHTAPTNTIAAIPEGALLNYLTRRSNPTPYVVFMSEVWAFGEQTMFDAYRKSPPDYIALVHRDSSEWGVPYFGQKKGYGREMMEWINQNYQPVHLIGSEPLKTNVFGIKILSRSH
jgi:hypothetical protein